MRAGTFGGFGLVGLVGCLLGLLEQRINRLLERRCVCFLGRVIERKRYEQLGIFQPI